MLREILRGRSLRGQPVDGWGVLDELATLIKRNNNLDYIAGSSASYATFGAMDEIVIGAVNDDLHS